MKILWNRKWQPTPVFSPGKSHGQRSLVGLQSTRLKRVRHGWATKRQQQIRLRHPRASEGDLIRRSGLHRGNHITISSWRWALVQCDRCQEIWTHTGEAVKRWRRMPWEGWYYAVTSRGPSGAPETEGDTWIDSSPAPSEQALAHPHLELRLQPSRTVKEETSVVLSPQGCGTLLQRSGSVSCRIPS